MADEARPSREDELWRQKVRSVDDSLKSLRGATNTKASRRESRERAQSRPQETDKKGRGLFSFLQAKQRPAVVPVKPSEQRE